MFVKGYFVNSVLYENDFILYYVGYYWRITLLSVYGYLGYLQKLFMLLKVTQKKIFKKGKINLKYHLRSAII